MKGIAISYEEVITLIFQLIDSDLNYPHIYTQPQFPQIAP